MRHLLCSTILLLCGCAHMPPGESEPIERGWIDRGVLNQPAHLPFKAVYDTVQVEAPFVAMLKTVASGVETIVFLGTWCSDSRREVPRFLKVADRAGIPPAMVKLYALDRSKKSDDGISERYGIQRLPTFIFLKDGKELGRIVEAPARTLEEDMVTILAKAGGVQ